MKSLFLLCVLLFLFFGCLELSVSPVSEHAQQAGQNSGGTSGSQETELPIAPVERVIPATTPLENNPFVDEDLPTSGLDVFSVE